MLISHIPARICSTIVQSRWDYSPNAGKFCYDKAFDLVKSTICEVFAGPAKHGIHSASLQKTLYDTERLVLERVPQVIVDAIDITAHWHLL